MKKFVVMLFRGLCLFCLFPEVLYSQSSAFIFQGSLSDSGQPATGVYDLNFSLYDSVTGGNQVAGPVSAAATPVTNGLFSASLDFGSSVFDGTPRWLEVCVRTNGAQSFVALSPRQPVASTPYAISAATVTGSIPAGSLAGAFTNSVTFNNPGNTFTGGFAGDGSQLTNLNSSFFDFGLFPPGTLTGAFPSAVTFNNPANAFYGVFAGDASQVTNLNASSLATGTVPPAMLSGAYLNAVTFNNPSNAFTGAFAGDGSQLTNLNSSFFDFGLFPPATLTGMFSSAVTFSNPANAFYGVFAGDGSQLTNMNASALVSGIVPLAALSGITSNQIDAATDAAYRAGAGIASNTVSVFNVKDFGAVGDGSTDDSAAIMAAFQAWTNSGGTLYFPTGHYYDTNTYTISGAIALGDYDSTPYYSLTIKGDGRGSTHWNAAINNAVFITCYLAIPIIQDITLQNVGSGTNTGLHTTSDSGPVFWSGVRFMDWDLGADVQGAAGGCIYAGAFVYCGVGLRVPGYCDGWTGDMRLDGNSRAGLEIGGYAPYYPGVRRSQAGRWHVTGAENNIAVLVGEGVGQDISGYIENSTNCTVAIGHPPYWGDPDDWVGPVVIENLAVLNYSGVPGDEEVVARIYAPTAQVSMRNILAGDTNLVSTDPAFDTTPVIMDGVAANVLMLFSDGTTIPGSNPPIYTTVNMNEQRFNKSTQYFAHTTDGAMTLGDTNGPKILSGQGSPLNVVAAPVGSLYLQTDGGPGSTLYVKESGTDSSGWTPK